MILQSLKVKAPDFGDHPPRIIDLLPDSRNTEYILRKTHFFHQLIGLEIPYKQPLLFSANKQQIPFRAQNTAVDVGCVLKVQVLDRFKGVGVREFEPAVPSTRQNVSFVWCLLAHQDFRIVPGKEFDSMVLETFSDHQVVIIGEDPDEDLRSL